MKSRSQRPAEERQARSRAVKHIAENPLLRGSLVSMARTCGKAGCRCQQGEKHVWLHLAVRLNNRRRKTKKERRYPHQPSVAELLGGRAESRQGRRRPYNGVMVEVLHDGSPLLCARCGAELRPGSGDFYVVRIEAVADPTPPSFSAEDLARDPRVEIERLIAQLRDSSEQELMDQVYRRLVIHLCGPCYRTWIEDPAR